MRKCEKHPRYKGKKQPNYDCDECWEIWETKQERGKRNRPARVRAEEKW